MNPKKILLIASSLFYVSAIVAQTEVKEFTLKQAQVYALENHTSAKNSALEAEIANYKVKELMAIGYPQINGTVSYTNFINLPTSLIPGEFFGLPAGEFAEVQFGTPHNASAGISASQLIFDGRYLIGVKATKLLVDVYEQSQQLTDQELKSNVAKAYFTCLVAHENLDLLNDGLDLLNKVFFETIEYYKQGFVEKLDVDRLQLTVSNLQTTKMNIEKQLKLAYDFLQFQMGMPINEEILLSENIESLIEQTKSFTVDESAQPNRVEMTMLNTQISLQQLNKKRYNAGYLPSLAAFAQTQFDAQRNEFSLFDFNEKWYNTTLWGLQLNIPIWDSFQKNAQVQQTKLTIMQLENQKEMMTEAFNLELEKAKSDFSSATLEMESQKKNLDLANSIYETTRIKYTEGVGSSLEMSAAEQQLFQTQANYINSLYNVLVAKTDLEKAMGK